eukprot:5104670-Prorocentrum_lima.AAC.1
MSGMTSLMPAVGLPAARSATTSAASFPAKTAPGIAGRCYEVVVPPKHGRNWEEHTKGPSSLTFHRAQVLCHQRRGQKVRGQK